MLRIIMKDRCSYLASDRCQRRFTVSLPSALAMSGYPENATKVETDFACQKEGYARNKVMGSCTFLEEADDSFYLLWLCSKQGT